MSESFESITDLLSTAAPDSFGIATRLYGPCLQATIASSDVFKLVLEAWTLATTDPKSVHKTLFGG